MKYKVRIRYRRGDRPVFTIAETVSEKKALKWAEGLSTVLGYSHNRDDFKLFVVKSSKLLKKVKRPHPAKIVCKLTREKGR